MKAEINECELKERKGFWHLCTNGEIQADIFLSDDDFKSGMNVVALSLLDIRESGCEVTLYAFALMNNHLHELVYGSYNDCFEYFRCQKNRISRLFSTRVSFINFKCELIAVEDQNSLQNEICYIHRNGYLVNSGMVPYSYRWSTAPYYFNEILKVSPLKGFRELTFRQKRLLTHSVVSDRYDELKLADGYISPLSFCAIVQGESLFRNAHQYFHKLSRSYEAYSLIAKRLGEIVFLTDEDLYSVLCNKCKTIYNIESPRLLNPRQRLEMAKLLRKDFNSTNAQLKRMLNLSTYILQELFPK